MKRGRRALARAPLLLLCTLLAGCDAGWRLGRQSSDASVSTALAAADRDSLAGRAREANARYEAIVRDHPDDPGAAVALLRQAMLRLEPGSPIRDRRAAQTLLRTLATEHGDTLAGREARIWRGLTREIDRCEVEATRRGADAEKLRQTLDSIRDSDLELEQHP